MRNKTCESCRHMRVKLPLKFSEEYLHAVKKIDTKSYINWEMIANIDYFQSRLLYREAIAECKGGDDGESMIYTDPEKHKTTFKIGVLHPNRDGYSAWKEAQHCPSYVSMDD